MIPNRIACPLHPVERLAESGKLSSLADAAQATGNWTLLRIIRALVKEQKLQRRTRR